MAQFKLQFVDCDIFFPLQLVRNGKTQVLFLFFFCNRGCLAQAKKVGFRVLNPVMSNNYIF